MSSASALPVTSCGALGYPSQITPEARARIAAFWSGGSIGGRPALHLTYRDATAVRPATGHGDHTNAYGLVAAPTTAWQGSADLKQRDLDPDWQVHLAQQALGVHGLAEGVPRTVISFGSHIALLPALLGYEYEYASGTAWTHPVDDVYGRPIPTFNPAHPILQRLDDGMRRAAALVDGRIGLVSPPMGLDALTLLSLLRGAERMCEDLIDDPDRVEAWLVPVRAYWQALVRHFHERSAALGCQGSASWLHTWAPGSFEAVQCDAAVLLSKPMFSRFVLPELTASAACFDYALYHLDGTCQLRFLDQIAAVPGIRGIQWNPEPGANHIEDPRWIEVFRDIRTRGLLLQFNAWESRTVEQVIAVTRALGPDGLMFALPEFPDQEAAQQALARITSACG